MESKYLCIDVITLSFPFLELNFKRGCARLYRLVLPTVLEFSEAMGALSEMKDSRTGLKLEAGVRTVTPQSTVRGVAGECLASGQTSQLCFLAPSCSQISKLGHGQKFETFGKDPQILGQSLQPAGRASSRSWGAFGRDYTGVNSHPLPTNHTSLSVPPQPQSCASFPSAHDPTLCPCSQSPTHTFLITTEQHV